MSFFIITRNYAAYMCLFVCMKKYKYINALLCGSQGSTSDIILQKPPTLLFVEDLFLFHKFECFACINVSERHAFLVPAEAREGMDLLQTELSSGCKLPCHAGTEPGPQQEQ